MLLSGRKCNRHDELGSSLNRSASPFDWVVTATEFGPAPKAPDRPSADVKSLARLEVEKEPTTDVEYWDCQVTDLIVHVEYLPILRPPRRWDASPGLFNILSF